VYGDENEPDLGRIRYCRTADRRRILLGYSGKLAMGFLCDEYSPSPTNTRSDSVRTGKLPAK
jgi:hypothetical protein